MEEPSFQDREDVRRLIHAFFSFAEVAPTNWNGTVNDEVVGVFTTMYIQTVKCSNATAFVPSPPMGPPTFIWLASQFASGAFRQTRERLSQACARKVIGDYISDLHMATMEVSSLRCNTSWA